MDATERAFRARALAQAHPLSPLARRFINRAVDQEAVNQPMAESAQWASVALINGYCLRRVEEEEAGIVVALPDDLDPEVLQASVGAIAEDLRVGDPTPHVPWDQDVTFGALDRIIASEVDRRSHGWRNEVDDSAIGELEAYITWWAVSGYALRVAEAAGQAARA